MRKKYMYMLQKIYDEEKFMNRMLIPCIVVIVSVVFAVNILFAGESITLFTGRKNATEQEVIKDFEASTGIKVIIVDGKPEELIEKIAASGDEPEADLFMTVDGGTLEYAKEQGIFQKTQSSEIEKALLPSLRDTDNAWVGVTTRARVIVYAKDRVDPAELSSYLDLASPSWKGKVLVRSSDALYNRSLAASLISCYGEEKVRDWAEGLVANFAREPKGNDRDQAKAVREGIGDIAIMNTYYIGNMLKSKDAEEVEAAQAVGVFFPDQAEAGTHINICGIGLVKGAKNPDAAIKLVEYLLSVPAQEKLSLGNSEFPVNPKAKKSPLLESWGAFKSQKIDFAELSKNKEKATAILKESGWK